MVWVPEGHFGRHMPLILLTGFLGSGKTSLLNSLLADPRLRDTAVAINEFGEVSLDHLFVEAPEDDVIVLANGCLCCFVTDDLEASLARIFQRGVEGDLPAFKRIVMETSGLADPEHVLRAVLDNPVGGRFLWLDRIITTVDALHGAEQLKDHPEARKQVQLADLLVITKTDLAEESRVADLRSQLTDANPKAHHVVGRDAARIDEIFSPLFLDEENHPSPISDWFQDHLGREGEGRLEGAEQPHHPHHGSGLGHENHKAHAGGHSHQADGATLASSVTLFATIPVDWRNFDLWLSREQRRLGERLLRVKGIVNVAGSAQPVIIHGVRATAHVPVSLKQWPDADRRTRLVFITSGENAEDLRHSWDAFLAEHGVNNLPADASA